MKQRNWRRVAKLGMKTMMKVALLIAVLTLSACVGGGTPMPMGGSSGDSVSPAAAAAATAAAQETSGAMNPGETNGPEGTTDSGEGAGFGAISG